MVVGVPGSGIGGLYYIMLGLAMPALELVQTCRRRSSPQRWRVVGIQAGHAIGILAALAGLGWLLVAGCGWVIDVVSESTAMATARRDALMQSMASVSWSWVAWLSALTLFTVILLPAMLAWVLCLHDRRRAKNSLSTGRTNSSSRGT